MKNLSNTSTLEKENEERQYRRMTETPVSKLILQLAVPTIISMLITNIYNTGDTYFVSRIGTSASGAVGIVFALMANFQALGFMFGHGAGSIISRHLGAEDPDAAVKFASTSFFGSFGVGILAALFCMVFMNPILRLLGTTDTILPYARAYAFWIFLSGPFLATSCVLNNILRYEGRAFYAMIGLTAGGILNLIGDPILMFGFHLGVSGAGISTAVSQVISFLILLRMFYSGKTVTHFSISTVGRTASGLFRWKTLGRDISDIVKTGFASFVRQTLNSVSTGFLTSQASAYGDAAIAGMSIVGRVVFLMVSVAIGIGQGLQPVAAFNYGAGKYRRVKRGYGFTVAAGTVVLGIIALVMAVFASPVIAWFRPDADVVRIGAPALRWQCATCLLQAWIIGSNMLFQSIGKSFRASLLAALKSGVCFIPLVCILPKFWGINGVILAQPLADVITAAVTVPFIVPFMRELREAEQKAARNYKKV